jgi:peptidoglycan/LPS O-acetylase OafA/YrhL
MDAMTNTPTHAGDEVPAAVADTPRTSRAALLLACVAVGAAIKINGGNYHPAALALILSAVVASLAGTLAARLEPVERLPPRLAAAAVAAALAAQLAMTFVGRLVPTDAPGPTGPAYAALVGCAACLAPVVLWAWGGAAPRRSWSVVARVGFPVALLLHLLAGSPRSGRTRTTCSTSTSSRRSPARTCSTAATRTR